MNNSIGNLSFELPQKGEPAFDKPYSEFTARKIDEEAHTLVDGAHERTKQLLTEHREDVEKVAQRLLEKEVLTRDDMIELLGNRPFDEKRTLPVCFLGLT